MQHRDKTVVSLFGTIRLRRAYYHCATCRHGVVPWDKELRLSRRSLTLAAEELAALAGTLTDFEEASEWSLQRLCGLQLSESTVERVTEEAGERLRDLYEDGYLLDDDRRWSWHRDAFGRTCGYVSLDATGVRQQGPGGARAEGRMAYVATVYNARSKHDPRQPQRHQARYLAAICDLATIAQQLSRHAAAVGFHEVQQPIAISDGGNGLEDVFREYFPRAEVILDFWHAREHIVELAQELCPGDEAARTKWVDDRSHQLRHEGGSAVLQYLEDMDLTGQRATARQAHAEHVRYFRNHVHKMDYPRYRANGWQIGSGPVESACKTVVGRRLKQSGMRWGVAGADAVCHLRALHQSEPHRWHSFWRDYRA